MNRVFIVGGVMAVLVGMGFVCPQVAELRDSGALFTWQVLLLGLGVGLTGAGVAGLIFGGIATRTTS